MKVLVIGGTGLIGSHAAKELSARGHHVTVMARRAPTRSSFDFLEGDYVDGGVPAAVLARFEGLVFASGIDWRIQAKGDALAFFRRVNVDAPAALFEAARVAGIRRGVLVSSYYHVVRQDIHSQPYIQARLESEEAILAACRPSLSLSIVQPSWVMGPVVGTESVSFGGLIAKHVDGWWPVIAPPGGTNWISGRSLGFAIAEALERGAPESRHLVGDTNLTWAEVFERFAAASGRKRRVWVLPATAITFTGWVRYLLRELRGRNTGWDERNWSKLLTQNLFFDAPSSQQVLSYPTADVLPAIVETYQICSNARASLSKGAKGAPSPMADT